MAVQGPELTVQGVTFDTVRAAITDLYFRTKDMTQEMFEEAQEYVVPMQHNIFNPIVPGGFDTWIQYWINADDRLTHDYSFDNLNTTMKEAHITLRFLGRRGEVWAKAFHHLTKRRRCADVFMSYCNAILLPYVSPIVPINIDFFGTGNTTKAFTLAFKLQYDETLDYSEGGSGADVLQYISFPAGGFSDGVVSNLSEE